MDQKRIIILLTYFERPNLVKNFFRSLLEANKYYSNWELAVIDDGSTTPVKPIAERILKPHLRQIKFYNSEMTPEMKKLSGGVFIGKYMNEAIKSSDADIGIMVGDDDEIYPDYLKNLAEFFDKNPDVLSCYSNVHVYNPLTEKSCNAYNLYCEDPNWKGHSWFGKPINPAYKVDGTQVAFRLKCCKVFGAWNPYPIWINHDAEFFKELSARCGKSVYTGFISMYKGRHDGQLVKNIQQGRGAFGEKGMIDKPKKVLFI